MFLRNTPSNSAYNKISIKIGKQDIDVKGYIGVESDNSKEVKGAFCWGDGKSLNTFVFKIDPLETGTPKITFIEHPDGWMANRNREYLKAYLEACIPKLYKKWIERNLFPSKKSSGKYFGKRLEAHRRDRTRPADSFSSFKNTFSDLFAEHSRSLNVTYK